MPIEADPQAPNCAQPERDWSNDIVLRALQDLEEPVGTLIRAFPGRAALPEQPDWLERWFVDLAERFRNGEGPDLKRIVASAPGEGDLSLLAKQPVGSSVRLVSLRPMWFRGFRDNADPIRFEADLIIVEGRNSSGKTSISEAIEWVLTGQLSRRTSGEHGHPTELADCIANEFRPDDALTSVELVVEVDGQSLVLTRVLTKDYSTVASHTAESDLLIDGKAATKDDAQNLFDELLAGVHPILMQHNLRRFVHDDPSSRRRYFERLLQISELTALVEKGVIGKKRAQEIPNPTGGTGLASVRDLANEVKRGRGTTGAKWAASLASLERSGPEELPAQVTERLVEIADAFLADDVDGTFGIAAYRNAIEAAQQRQRQSRLPLLSNLEAALVCAPPTLVAIDGVTDELKTAVNALATAREAAATITVAQEQIARASLLLIEGHLIETGRESDQECPVCEDGVLTPERVAQINSWGPLAMALEAGATRKNTAAVKVDQEVARLKQTVSSIVPIPSDPQKAAHELAEVPQRTGDLGRAALESAASLREMSEDVTDAIDRISARLVKEMIGAEDVDTFAAELATILAPFLEAVDAHRRDVDNLREAVGAASRDDAQYRLREKWLKAAGLTAAIAEDVAWEAAKIKASAALDGLREGLIELRTEIVEDARHTFSEEMTEVWRLLRQDSGAHFSQLHVPPARGKGFKLEFELKAVISDGRSDSEVDALRVFSESQVNVVGIAAYVTRANRLGHKLLIFDDPVQSMDEEHFRSFAANLLPALIEDGHQVVILTHSDAFAGCIHDHHYGRESYATLSTRASKRKGCCVDEGSRRVAERLKVAQKAAEDGDLQRAWRFVRLAMERMYTLVMAKADDTFQPESWRGLTAEDMWERGVGELIEEAAPGKGNRLKEILRSTAAGAHDKPATSETDLTAAVDDLRTLLSPLRLGAG